MKKSTKIILIVLAIIVVFVIALAIYGVVSIRVREYKNELREEIKIELESESELIVFAIDNYCAAERMKIELDMLDGPIVCTNSENIIANIDKIVELKKDYEIIELIYNGLEVRSLLLKSKDVQVAFINENADLVDENDKNNESEDVEEEKVCPYTENLVGDEDLSFLSSDAQYLYNKYIKYYNDVYKIEGSDEISSIETNNFKNININDSSSDEYLIKYSILSILKDNNVDISKYHFDMCIDCSDEDYYKNGYKITTTQIETYIKNNFKLNRKIDFKNTEISFGCTTLISLAYYDEGYYKLVDFTSIPSGGCFGETTYSKVLKEETSGNNLIIYTEFMIYGLAGDMYYLNSFVEENNEYEFILKDSSEKCGEWPEGCFGVYGYEHIKSCILNNYSDKVGKFKHIFTKDSNGNYYWVSTQKIN